uniref:SET domain-containing protein n=1 Tax=Fundulus heteroclitus TaxID=8078 RepID=A0A3Q2T448_FUNHE
MMSQLTEHQTRCTFYIEKKRENKKLKAEMMTSNAKLKNRVFATKDFARGAVVCDYHGPVVSAEEGRRVLEALQPGEGSYIFFFKAGEQKLCVNSQVAPCQCHPDKATFGRMINHSTKKLNVKGMVFHVPGEALPVLLIKAARDIKAGEELLIDYGVTQRSFGGEAQGLSWLDS